MTDSEIIEPVDPKHASTARRVAWSLSAVTILLLAVGVFAVRKLGQPSQPPRLDLPLEIEAGAEQISRPLEDTTTQWIRPQVLQPQVGTDGFGGLDRPADQGLSLTPILPSTDPLSPGQSTEPWRESVWPQELEPSEIRAARLPEKALPTPPQGIYRR